MTDEPKRCPHGGAIAGDEPEVILNGEKYELADEADSREQLEADVRKVFGYQIELPMVMRWLDRQAAITSKEWCYSHDALEEELERVRAERDEAVEAYDAHMAAHDAWHEAEDITYTRNRFSALEQAKNERIARLTAERDEWQRTADDYKERKDALVAERDKLREKVARQRRQLGELQDAIHARNNGELKRQWQRQVDDLTAERDQLQEQHGRQAKTIERLTAERDRLRRFVDGGAYDCMTCEAKAELAERADSLEAELERKQRACDVQRESFLKLEAENAELRRALDGASDALESI